jgi:hypothetical protein
MKSQNIKVVLVSHFRLEDAERHPGRRRPGAGSARFVAASEVTDYIKLFD